jgi:hypothetical protein
VFVLKLTAIYDINHFSGDAKQGTIWKYAPSPDPQLGEGRFAVRGGEGKRMGIIIVS